MAHGRGKFKAKILDATAMNRALHRIAHQILERNPDLSALALIGIRTRGLPLAERLAKIIKEIEGTVVEVGILDVRVSPPSPGEGKLDIASNIDGKTLILVDDVLFTGRTLWAALDAISRAGRPSAIQAAVLIDRGHRELPIHADYVGKNVPTAPNEIVVVFLKETDQEDQVILTEKEPNGL